MLRFKIVGSFTSHVWNSVRIVLVTGTLFSAGSLFSQQFLVTPYLQPGNASTLSKEQKVLIWQTDSVPGNFNVHCGLQRRNAAIKNSASAISSVELRLKGKPSRLYRAVLKDLLFDTI